MISELSPDKVKFNLDEKYYRSNLAQEKIKIESSFDI